MTNKKELSIEELENVNGGVDLAPDLYNKYVGGRVELYCANLFHTSHGGVIVDVARGTQKKAGKIAYKIEFDSPKYNGWYWQDHTGPDYEYLDSSNIKPKTWVELQADDMRVM